MLEFVEAITLGAFGSVSVASKGYIFLSLVVFVLGDIRVYFCALYSGDMSVNIKWPVNQYLNICFTLSIPNIYLYYSQNNYVDILRNS